MMLVNVIINGKPIEGHFVSFDGPVFDYLESPKNRVLTGVSAESKIAVSCDAPPFYEGDVVEEIRLESTDGHRIRLSGKVTQAREEMDEPYVNYHYTIGLSSYDDGENQWP